MIFWHGHLVLSPQVYFCTTFFLAWAPNQTPPCNSPTLLIPAKLIEEKRPTVWAERQVVRDSGINYHIDKFIGLWRTLEYSISCVSTFQQKHLYASEDKCILKAFGGELALGKNVFPWAGTHFENAVLISERLIYEYIVTYFPNRARVPANRSIAVRALYITYTYYRVLISVHSNYSLLILKFWTYLIIEFQKHELPIRRTKAFLY